MVVPTEPAIASIFQRPTSSNQIKFTWLEPIEGSCLHGVYGVPKPTSKIAAFDIDGTLIKVKSGKKFPTDSEDWKLYNSNVPKRLKELYSENHTIILLSNQNFKSQKVANDFKEKLKQLARVFNVPFRVFAAREKDHFRKPLTGMWDYFIKHLNDNVSPDLNHCFFVGDAAGRPAKDGTAKDWTDTDRKLALNIGLTFFTPEEFFDGAPQRTDFILSGFSPLDHNHKGPPGVGKTRCFTKHFAPRGYVHVNQDTLKSNDKCLSKVMESIKSDQSCVVDNTNRSKSTRSAYIAIAKENGCRIRCIFFDSTLELARHNNIYRANYCKDENRQLLPQIAFDSYFKNFESPMIDEGFDEIKNLRFVFEGDEAQLKRWNQYLF
ncbi:polynucleotide kinase 3 phosphatase-domain-containing protein [Phakopsora pachyrhizi]|nr:polynucleotide kinase 3 phosphatase-domain-containing protein [Phakopsora pachyrhizi]